MAPVHDLIVAPRTRPLVGSVPTPGDESIGQLALVCAALADGTSEIRRLSSGSDVNATLRALRALGVSVDLERRGVARVGGASLHRLSAPKEPLACDGSVKTVRLLCGVLVAQAFRTVLTGGEPLAAIDMAETAGVFRRRGGQIEGVFSQTHAGVLLLPLEIGPLPRRRRLSDVEHELRMPVPGLKEAILLSGLYADGSTYVRERIVSRDHAERMLQALDVPLLTVGPMAKLDVEHWSAKLPAFCADVPGDFSAAAFLIAAAAVVPGSRVCARNTGLNPTRTGALDVLRHMGGIVEPQIHASVVGEPEGTVCVSYAPLRGVATSGEILARASDDISVLAALAARAHGPSEIALGMEPSADPSPVGRLASVLRAFGVTVETTRQGLVIAGRGDEPLNGADVDAANDVQAAALAILLGLSAAAPTRVRGVDGLASRFPRFVGTLRALGADLRVQARGM